MALNALSRLRRLIPQSPLIIVEVISIGTDGTSMVETAAGNRMRAIGTKVQAGKKAWLKDGVIAEEAPNMTHYELEVP